MAQERSGFTLVELSIVLVILGLLVGGVLSGQSLIHAAELRSITQEKTQYVTALGAFKDKYFGIPGDMKNAVKFWGAADGGTDDGLDSACQAVTTPATGTETCNGNGDGRIYTINGNNISEYLRAWQHLSNSGLIEGSYTGVDDPDNGNVPGLNNPTARFGGNMWLLKSNPDASDGFFFPLLRPGVLFLELAATSGNGLMTPEDMYNIDRKTDDGQPLTGTMVVKVNTDCADTLTNLYELQETTMGCSPVFNTGY